MNSWISIFTFTFATIGSAFVVFTASQVTVAFCGQKMISDYHIFSALHFWIIVPVAIFSSIFFVGTYALSYHSYSQKSGRYIRCIPKNFQVWTLTWIHCKPKSCRQCRAYRELPLSQFSQGKPCFHYREPCFHCRDPLNENIFFHLENFLTGKTLFSLQGTLFSLHGSL